MTIKGTTTKRAIRENSAPINRLGPISWIPAFAGMTTGDGNSNSVSTPTPMPDRAAAINTCIISPEFNSTDLYPYPA